MRRNPERLAWLILSLAVVSFCLVATGIPLGLRFYLLSATDDMDTQLQVIEGTVLVQQDREGDLIAVTESDVLSPGVQVLTDDTSWASLDLFERSHLTLYSNTKVKLEQIKTPRFDLSDGPEEIQLEVSGGLVRVGVALPGERGTRFQVRTPHTLLQLEEGSYRIEVTNEGTLVTVSRGQALVDGQGIRMMVPQGTRTMVNLDGELADPMTAARNLVQDGDFQQPLSTAWLTDTIVLEPTMTRPAAQVVENGGRRSVRLVRREPDDGVHSEVALRQPLDQDMRDFVRLEVSADILIDFQSLSGGGLLSSEFPIIIRLDYKDRWGKDQFWTHGFYYQNQDGYPIAPDSWGEPSGEQLPRGVWFPYESGNLLESLGESGPVQVTGFTIYASGWNYDSQVSEVQVIVE